MAIPQRRILLTSQPLDAGVPRHVADVVASLDRARFGVTVACPRESELWAELEGVSDVERHAIAPHRRPALADVRSLVRLLPLVRQADVVHAHSSKAGFLTRLAAALTGRTSRCIFTPHAWSFWGADGPERRLYLALERLAAPWCRAIVAVSEYERDAGLAAGVGRSDQYRVIPNGIDVERFSRPPATVPGRIVMVGRLAPRQKRHDLAVAAFARVRDRHPSAELVLVGDGPARPAVEALISRMGLSESVRLSGPTADMPAVLEEADCLLLATDYESCPLSVLEAMAAAVPVVASRVGGIPELVLHGRTGLLVTPGDPEALADALDRVLSHPDEARTLGAEGRRIARERFSQERMLSRLVELYEDVA
jgi:glycosyltransferase involved in cell wall biosynthesis